MTYIRIRWEKMGGHYHCRLFTAQRFDGTYANCGSLVFDEREWDEVQDRLCVEWLPEGAEPMPMAQE